ncbi:endonuclease/exonuclease/phosphatase family protein [Aurantiacibacter gangjinensis]|uniref:Endonuclease/exonuclease/phosphatase domain-containing protein n=1 Tax=Aurantiacibacter gangjinensis TaxID=502682 RepID=A0A0G9MRC1_9SPHN|nr:endonuclease/exonuclease/phosphatase family protein [Aurantiacibacter gangjinensis]KLE33255.1 hypothetical protein AAW01_04690 [Aurantiacibacter gangjinensis]
MRYVEIGLAVLAALAVLVSLLPTDMWFVRTVDLVREPMSWAALVLLVLGVIFLRGWDRKVVPALLGLVIVINLWRMWPYLPFGATEIALSEPVETDRCFTALAVNVKVKNEDYAGIAQQVRSVDPDVLFLMETDERWVRELQDVITPYPTSRAHPQPEAFGLVFASRVPASRLSIVENTHRDTPTVYATLQLEGTAPVEFIGLHPKPPLPGWNTEERDENIIRAGTDTPDSLPDGVTMGDFNDVPWSRTTTAFREEGNWRDPRVGRGTFPTFPSDYLLLGWPLDQLMVRGDVRIRSFEVMPDNGSDHRAMFGEFCVPRDSNAARAGQTSPPGESALEPAE